MERTPPVANKVESSDFCVSNKDVETLANIFPNECVFFSVIPPASRMEHAVTNEEGKLGS
jgi:hypothetical protein